jgi:hypothetical protein
MTLFATDTTRLLAALAAGLIVGIAISALLAHYHRKSMPTQRPSTVIIGKLPVHERLAAFVLSVTSGVFTSILTNWLMFTGRMEQILIWLISFGFRFE